MDERIKLLVANALSAILALIVGLWTGHTNAKLGQVYDEVLNLNAALTANEIIGYHGTYTRASLSSILTQDMEVPRNEDLQDIVRRMSAVSY